MLWREHSGQNGTAIHWISSRKENLSGWPQTEEKKQSMQICTNMKISKTKIKESKIRQRKNRIINFLSVGFGVVICVTICQYMVFLTKSNNRESQITTYTNNSKKSSAFSESHQISLSNVTDGMDDYIQWSSHATFWATTCATKEAFETKRPTRKK